jgi:hypothetical protein
LGSTELKISQNSDVDKCSRRYLTKSRTVFMSYVVRLVWLTSCWGCWSSQGQQEARTTSSPPENKFGRTCFLTHHIFDIIFSEMVFNTNQCVIGFYDIKVTKQVYFCKVLVEKNVLNQSRSKKNWMQKLTKRINFLHF